MKLMSHVRKRRKRAHTINILIQEFTCENVPSYHTFFQEYKKEIFSRMTMLLFCIYWKHDHWLSSILKDKNIRHVHYIQGPRCLDKSWGWVNDDEPVIFLRKKLCFGLMMFPTAQHLAKTQHSLQYYGLESHLSGTVWNVSKPSSLPLTSRMNICGAAGMMFFGLCVMFLSPRNILMICSVTINN